MSIRRPNELLDSGYVEITDEGWELKEGAPEDIKKLFEEFMKDLNEEGDI